MVERRVVIVVLVVDDSLAVRRGVEDDLFLVEALQRPRWVEVIERVEQSCDEMH